MANWIDKVAQQDQAQAANVERAKELQLHNAKIIKARVPALWDALKERVIADCSELRQKSPNNRRHHCHVTKTDIGFTINGEGPLPRVNLYVEMILDGHIIDLIETRAETRFPSPIPNRRQEHIDIVVDGDEEVGFRYSGTMINSIEDLSQVLISRVCGIAD